MKQPHRPHLLVAIALAVAAFAGIHTGLRNALTDLRFHTLGRAAGGDVVVVAIDAHSIERIGVWPWPRRLHAELLDRLTAAGARAVLFDIDFSTASDAASDAAFLAALEAAGGSTVLPYFRQARKAGPDAPDVGLNHPLAPFAAQSWGAIVNVSVDSDGLVRRYPFGENVDGAFLPSMGALAAGAYAPHRAPFLIDFGIRTSTIPVVSYVDVLDGDAATLSRLAGKTVIIGGTALELGDRFSVPNGEIVSGPALQALAAESILQGRALRLSSPLASALAIAVLALIMVATWRRLNAGRRVALLFAFAGAAEAAAWIAQAKTPIVIDTSLFHVAVAAYLAALALDEIDLLDLIGRIAERRFQRIAMSLGDGLVCADAQGLITVWNPAAQLIFGHRRDDIIGRPFATLCSADGAEPPPVLTGLPATLLQRPGGYVVELTGRRRSGESFPCEACISGWQGADGYQYGVILRDISVRKREAERVRYLAEYDTLTGLANRNSLHTRLGAALAHARASGDEIALLLLDVDHFQRVNDLLGNASGDQVLTAVALRLRALFGDNALPAARLTGDGAVLSRLDDDAAFIARLGGDQFAVVLPGAELAGSFDDICARIVAGFEPPLVAGSRQQRVTLTIGGALSPADGSSADELLGNAHLALCRAKASARGHGLRFEREVRDALEARLALETELTLAVERGEFELFYQPQVSLIDRRVIGAEALIRWRHPARGLVPPVQFMALVNASPLSDTVAGWVLRTACAQARDWERRGHALRMGVNLSPSQFQSGALVPQLTEALAASQLPPQLLELEVTEDILLGDTQTTIRTFREIQAKGVHVVFDDFGTGYASLSYLKTFALDGLKIDRTFVRDLVTSESDAAIVGATVSLARQLGLTVIAEGIEDEATAELLLRMGCEQGQGYVFGKPMPAQAFAETFFGKAGAAVDAA
ncbi:MAG: EAL domain-containing protein [Xanthobacteraceae bacterium]|nr:EAL domain-containing protein [Xanthobacteraceae bacterium]